VDFSLWKERLFSGGFFAESAVGFVYIPFLVFIGSLYFINVLGYSPGKASSVILITTGICMVFEPPAGRWVDKVGPGLPITVSLLMQAVALAWMGLSFSPTTTLGQMVIPLALMGIGVGISLPACNTAGMSAVDPERAGMGSGLMQMTFNIPAALGVGLVTSIIGGLTASKVGSGLGSRADLNDAATRYADAVQDGDKARADAVLAGLPQDSIDAIKNAVTSAASGAITVSMLVLAAVALAGAIFAWVVIGRRRTPDYIETTNAAAV
jgi:MFS family permease